MKQFRNNVIRAGLEAPSGYNMQPWRFVVVRDAEQKKKRRQPATPALLREIQRMKLIHF